MATYDYASPFGTLRYHVLMDKLIGMSFVDDAPSYPCHPVLHPLLTDYFHHHRPIHYPVAFDQGTPFQHDVWNALLMIPYGETRSYSDIARQIGKPLAIRAVGQACKRNPVGLVVPCHRVIGAHGALTGYSGKNYIDLKRQLLEHERISETR